VYNRALWFSCQLSNCVNRHRGAGSGKSHSDVIIRVVLGHGQAGHLLDELFAWIAHGSNSSRNVRREMRMAGVAVDVALGRLDGPVPRQESWRVLFRSRPLLMFAAAAAIFHFANGPLLLLVAQKLALAHPGYETGLTSAAIIITQLATIPMALLVTRANAFGRKPLAIIAFAAVPLRGLLCASSDNPSWLLGVQLLDGVGAGTYDALLPLLLADMMRGTGRYSLARGALGTIQGIGGSTGLGAAGFIVAAFGYNAAFLTLAAVAVIALLVMVVGMPETGPTLRTPDQPSLGGARKTG
jgi:predicted MFS family arabinose efflux permease